MRMFRVDVNLSANKLSSDVIGILQLIKRALMSYVPSQQQDNDSKMSTQCYVYILSLYG